MGAHAATSAHDLREQIPRGLRRSVVVGLALLVLSVVGSASSRAVAAGDSQSKVSGAGRTIIEGGTGGTSPLPVITTVAFHARAHTGDFECLALAPAAATGAESGQFEVNAMYVTGKVTSVEVTGHNAVLRGLATVTGLGAGHDAPFVAQVAAGGPGATITLEVSGLTFHETLIEGSFDVE